MPAKPSGTEATVVAPTKATRCARPVQMLTAKTAPVRSRQKATETAIAATASSPSRTANMPANDNSQFRHHHTQQINAATGRNRKKASPGCGLASGEANPARIAAPINPKTPASATAARRKLSLSTAEKRPRPSFLETLLATSLSPSFEMPSAETLDRKTPASATAARRKLSLSTAEKRPRPSFLETLLATSLSPSFEMPSAETLPATSLRK